MKQEIKVGQIWRSKRSYPNVGIYTIEILGWESKEVVRIRFTASNWEDGHWVEGTQGSLQLEENYYLVENE